MNYGDTMPRSLSLLSFAAAIGVAGAGFAQDTTADTTTKTTTAVEAEATVDADVENGAAAEGTEAEGTTAEGATSEGTATDNASEAAADPEATDTADTPTDESFTTGREVGTDQPAVYVKEKFGDWNLRCFRNADGEDPCQLYQLLRESGGNPVAEFSIFRIENQAPAVAGATAIVPLITLLTEELKISVDGGTAKSYPYRVCTEAGCVAQIGLTAQDIAAFKKGKKAQMVLVPAQAPDQIVKIDVSLSGFTAGYEAVGTFTE